MTNLRAYGTPPCAVAVLHGGPGALGEMRPVAERLAATRGVLEPLLSARSVSGQIEELHALLAAHAVTPVSVVGFSWGAWLAWCLAARYPECVRKLILVATPGFRPEDGDRTGTARWARLAPEQRERFAKLQASLASGQDADPQAFAELGRWIERVDAFDPLPDAGTAHVEYRPDVFQAVWPEAALMRVRGEFLAVGRHVRCPVAVIHGDHDPHPAESVRAPLMAILKDFRFFILPGCGHKPWIERRARDDFFRLLETLL